MERRIMLTWQTQQQDPGTPASGRVEPVHRKPTMYVGRPTRPASVLCGPPRDVRPCGRPASPSLGDGPDPVLTHVADLDVWEGRSGARPSRSVHDPTAEAD